MTLSEYEDQLMLNIFSNNEEGDILVQDDKRRLENQTKRYDLRPRPTTQKSQPKPNSSKKPANQNSDVSNYVPLQNQLPIRKNASENKDPASSTFSFEAELNKIKVPVPLLELLKNPTYRESFKKLLQPSILALDSVNLEDERPAIYLGSHVQDRDDDTIPPFYISLNIHDKLLHNCLLDSGASHNLMPKKVMDELGL